MMNKDLNENYYKTSDLALAGIISLFHSLKNIDRQNPRKAEFIFVESESLRELVEKYWQGELKVEPKAYFNQLRIIKARLYERN